jgi:Kinesin motor domain
MSLLKNSSREKVRVVCRVRPPNTLESSKNGVTCVKLTDQNIEIQLDDTTHNFNFDRIFGPDASQVSVFEYTATPLILDVLNGYNATIFAYGQTGSGKTVRHV